MAGWLNSLTGPAQIVVSTQPVDLEPHAARIEADAALLAHPALGAGEHEVGVPVRAGR